MKFKFNLIVTAFAPALLLAGVGALSVQAEFQSKQVSEPITMVAVVGGEAQQVLVGFRIAHKELRGFSPVTKLAVVLGNVGTNLPVAAAQGLHANAVNDGSIIKVMVRYRFVEPGVPADPEVHVSSSVFYNDPSYFFFRIDPALIVKGSQFEYQIIAEKLDAQGVRISTDSLPPEAFLNRDTAWIQVVAPAGAAALIGPAGERLTIVDGNPTDGQSTLDIPAGVVHSPSQISFNEVPLDDATAPKSGTMVPPVAIYRITADPPFSGAVRLSVLYPEYQPSISHWNLSGEKINQQILTIGVWDGFVWRPVKGRVDAINHLLTARVGNASYIGVFPAGASTPDTIAPTQKIITPNGDNMNEYAEFVGIDPSTNVDIYDVGGHKVRTLNAPNNLRWDGRDDGGKIVETGVYIYQFTESGLRISGVIAVAK